MISDVFLFLPLPGEMIQFDQYFSDGLKQPTSIAPYINLVKLARDLTRPFSPQEVAFWKGNGTPAIAGKSIGW